MSAWESRQRSRIINTTHCVVSMYAWFAAVDGYWKAWGEWSACSSMCDGGIQTRTRACVPPVYGGLDCEGDSQQTKPCEVMKCPSKTLTCMSVACIHACIHVQWRIYIESWFHMISAYQLTVSGLNGGAGLGARPLVMEGFTREFVSSRSPHRTEANPASGMQSKPTRATASPAQVCKCRIRASLTILCPPSLSTLPRSLQGPWPPVLQLLGGMHSPFRYAIPMRTLSDWVDWKRCYVFCSE